MAFLDYLSRFIIPFFVLGVEYRSSHMKGKCSTSELFHSPFIFNIYVVSSSHFCNILLGPTREMKSDDSVDHHSLVNKHHGPWRPIVPFADDEFKAQRG